MIRRLKKGAKQAEKGAAGNNNAVNLHGSRVDCKGIRLPRRGGYGHARGTPCPPAAAKASGPFRAGPWSCQDRVARIFGEPLRARRSAKAEP